MYSILVADDESHIREGIKCLFDYEKIGFAVTAEAANGTEAYTKIIAQQPDVVLLDIRMPGLSGLEVIQKVRQQGYTGKIVIISSYTDFKYAQEAIRYGVQYYLTKPIDEDELEEILRKFKVDMDKEQQAATVSHHYRQKAHFSIIKDILLGDCAFDQVDLSDMHFRADEYQVVIFDLYSADRTTSLSQFTDLLHLKNQDNRFYDHIALDGNEVLLLKGHHAVQKFQELLACYQSDRRPYHNKLLETFFITYGRCVNTLSEVYLSYQEACQLKKRRFFCEQDQHTIGYDDLPAFANCAPVISNDLLNNYAQRLIDCIQAFNRNMMADILREMQYLLYNSSDSIESIKLFLVDLHLQVKAQIKHLYANNDVPFMTNANIIRTIEQSAYLYEIILFYAERFEIIMSAIGNSSRDSVLDDILYYIHHNYATNITLENIAPLFGYNRSYLGKIFSKKMGQNFNSYVDYVRIEQSKILLLSDDAKVYTIAERVGYKNVDYFHIKFKKLVGQSPAEYRKTHKK